MASHLSAARGFLKGSKKVQEVDGESVDHLSRYELSFLPPEVRFAHRQHKPPVHPPSPWNPKLVEPVFVGDEKAPFEQTPDKVRGSVKLGGMASSRLPIVHPRPPGHALTGLKVGRQAMR
jgi:hypothetical protein